MAQAQYDMREFDRDAEEQSEARVVNVTDDVVRFEIGQMAGSKPRRYKLAPFGRADSGVSIQKGYTEPFRGVGRSMIRPTIESLTEREVYPGGPRLPQVVHEDRAPEFRRAWLAALADRGRVQAQPRAVVVTDKDGQQIEAVLAPIVPAAPPAPPPVAAAPAFDDEEDQTPRAIDVDPDDDPLATPDPAVAVPAPPASRAPAKARGK